MLPVMSVIITNVKIYLTASDRLCRENEIQMSRSSGTQVLEQDYQSCIGHQRGLSLRTEMMMMMMMMMMKMSVTFERATIVGVYKAKCKQTTALTTWSVRRVRHCENVSSRKRVRFL